jgi:hypothetical protein
MRGQLVVFEPSAKPHEQLERRSVGRGERGRDLRRQCVPDGLLTSAEASRWLANDAGRALRSLGLAVLPK